jgi:predicted small metal-binding protein
LGRGISVYGDTNMPSFVCADLGMECEWKAKAKTKDELLAKIAEHASSEHGIETIDDELMEKVEAAIK